MEIECIEGDFAIFPAEILVHIFRFLDTSSMCNASLVNSQWFSISRLDEYWKAFYEEKWATSNILHSISSRSWKLIYATRLEMECKYVKPCQDSPNSPKPQRLEDLNSKDFKYQQYVFAGETLRSKAYEIYPTENKTMANLLLQISGEEFASALQMKNNNVPEVFLKYGSVAAQCARGCNGPESDMLFAACFEFYAKAAVPEFFMFEHALAFWGDALVDLASKKEAVECETYLLRACSKLEEASKINPDNSMTQYYWGRALHRLATREHDADKQNVYYMDSTSKLQKAIDVSPTDVYILNEYGATLHEYSLIKHGEDADRFFQQAIDKYTLAFEHSTPKDAWTLRKWADAYYDWAKAVYSENYQNTENGVFEADISARIQSLLKSALEKYDEALGLDPKYINALNSGALAASTLAKLVSDEQEVDRLFNYAYERFQRAIEASPQDCSIEKCNWAMVLASEGSRRRELFEMQNRPTRRTSHTSHLAPPSSYPNSPRVSQLVGLVASAFSFNQTQQHPVVATLFQKAKQTLQPLLATGDKWAAFCMARVCACVGDPQHDQECQYWLSQCHESQYLQKASFWQLTYFEKVKDREWFQNMRKGKI